jgi:hypothetical protein
MYPFIAVRTMAADFSVTFIRFRHQNESPCSPLSYHYIKGLGVRALALKTAFCFVLKLKILTMISHILDFLVFINQTFVQLPLGELSISFQL